ncbi:RNA-binding motif protein, X chromosome-like isoform X3 [Physella acuta]|uniref:RNA-binding motif protein, X chromosome-like isoform X3 n=1 Tax=Physella acuta TaxID=109671 RepID=UPI0027DD28F6|nr:RNA-binding motif protein, X chromosome-like isoform X3 [Physella acuta]
MSEFRGRSSRGRGSRGRGGPPRGGPRGGGRGSYSSERDGGRGGYRGRGDGFSRGRGGPRHFSRDDDSPPRKIPMMSRGYDSDRGRGPPMGRRDRYEDSYDRGAPSRSRDSFSSPPRDSSRILDRLSPPRSSLRDRDFITSSRGDYLPPRSYSPPRDSGAYRESYTTSLREDRRDSFSRPAVRDYSAPRIDYAGDRGRDLRDSPRDFGSPRDYPPPRSADFREPLSRDFLPRDRLPSRNFDTDREFSPRGRVHSEGHSGGPSGRRGVPIDIRSGAPLGGREHSHGGDREYSSRSLSSRLDDRMSSRGPPREYRGRGGSRGMHGGRDDRGGRGGRGGYMNGSRGRGGPPRGRGRPDFPGGRGGRRSPSSRDGPLGKRPRMEGVDSYTTSRR